jgi:hypothetical protein
MLYVCPAVTLRALIGASLGVSSRERELLHFFRAGQRYLAMPTRLV